MIKRTLLIIFVLLFSVVAFGQKVVKVTAEYKYVVPQHITMEEAKRIALDRAKLQAIADEFGTVINQYNTTSVTNDGGTSNIDFSSFGTSEVKGEWIETIGKPEVKSSMEGDEIVIYVKVSGKIREFTNEKLDIKVMALRNGTDERNATTDFYDGDDIYLYFQAPVKGFLLVYLIDEDGESATLLLPYKSTGAPVYRIDSARPQILFSADMAPAEMRHLVDEYTMNTSKKLSHNDIYVIFSPLQITRPVGKYTSSAEEPESMDLDDFRKWLNKARANDTKLNLDILHLNVRKK